MINLSLDIIDKFAYKQKYEMYGLTAQFVLKIGNAMKVNENVKTLRELNQLSQEDMAEKLHMSVDGYAKLERGDRKIDIPKLERIANIFGIDASELLALDRKVICVVYGDNSTASSEKNNKRKNCNNTSYYGNTELIAQIEKLEMKLEHMAELLTQKDKEVELLRKLLDKNES